MRGFTLMEVLILIVIGMIIAGVAMPAVSSFDDMGVSADIRILQSDVEFAQARAIATGQSHRILFDMTNHRYQVESPPGVILDEPLGKRPWIRVLAKAPQNGSILSGCDFGGELAILFDGAGTPASGGFVSLQLGAFRGKLNVAPVTGVVSTLLP